MPIRGELPRALDQASALLVTTVEIGEGRSVTIEVFEGDDPRQVALDFCVTHGLPETIVDPLTLHLLDNLEINILEKPSQRTHVRF